jgi:hypothetical protein
LKAIDDEKAKENEDKMKKEGKYEEIVKSKDDEIATLKKDNETFKSFYDKAIADTQAENDKLLKEIPEAEREFVSEAIAGKDLQSQNKLLKTFAEKFKKPDF